METLLQDLRYGLRVLSKKPGFAAVAVMTLALGIGANTAIFSVVNAVMLRPLPYKDPDRIVTLWQNNTRNGLERDDLSPANFLDWREQNQVFDHMAAVEPFSHELTGQGEPEVFRSWLVTEGFFDALGVNAVIGRTFQPEEHQAGNHRVIVIGYNLWQRRFGGDPNLIGQEMLLKGQPYRVVGVMPPEFAFPPEAGRETWGPRVISEADKRRRGSAYLKVIARLKPGVTIAEARDQMNATAARLAAEYPETNKDIGATVVTLPEQLIGHVRPALLLLLGAVSFVLLIACANVANLLLVRGAERHREFAIRAALGAARVRLLRQLLTESVVLALLGGAGGILLAWWGIDLIAALSPGSLPHKEFIGVDGRVLGFALGVSVFTAITFGLVPAMQFSKPDLQETLKEGGRTSTSGFGRHKLRNALVVSEVALALVLLIGAGLLVRSFTGLLKVDPGFATDKVLAVEVHVWSRQPTPEKQAIFFEQTLERISAMPGVQVAGAVSALPFHENSIDIDGSFVIEGRPAPPQGQEPNAYHTIATPDYFSALRIPLLRGRLFTRSDNQSSTPVTLINETMARRFWSGDDPVGQKITVRFRGQSATREIIGVLGDVRHTGLDSSPRPEMFLPHLQSPYGSMTYVIRAEGDPLPLLQSVKNQIWEVSKEQPISSAATVEQMISKSLTERRFTLILLGSFAVIALALAGIGIYGLISFSTGQRTHEIGVRMALGAGASDILKMVVGEGVLLVLAGLGLGLAGAFALTRLLNSMLFGVTATDPLTFIAISILLFGVALLASYIPARRATKVNPMIALRHE